MLLYLTMELLGFGIGSPDGIVEWISFIIIMGGIVLVATAPVWIPLVFLIRETVRSIKHPKTDKGTDRRVVVAICWVAAIALAIFIYQKYYGYW